MKTYRGKHVHLYTKVYGRLKLNGRNYNSYRVCVRCGAKRKP